MNLERGSKNGEQGRGHGRPQIFHRPVSGKGINSGSKFLESSFSSSFLLISSSSRNRDLPQIFLHLPSIYHHPLLHFKQSSYKPSSPCQDLQFSTTLLYLIILICETCKSSQNANRIFLPHLPQHHGARLCSP